MPKYGLSQLPIKSALKIFTFLDQLLEEENLDPEYFRNQAELFQSQEKYFLYLYASEYFSDNHDSFLNNWIRKITADNGLDIVSDHLAMVQNNAQTLKKITNAQKLKSLEKEFLNSKQTVEDENQYVFERALSIFEDNDNNFRTFQRIPLYVSKKYQESFKRFFYETLKNSLDPDFIEKLYFNTFEFGGNITELKLLYLRIDQKSLLEEAFRIITKKYKDDILQRMKARYINEINSTIEEKLVKASPLRTKFLPKKLKYPKVTRLHFMKAMYNAFPHIRSAYHKSLTKNPSLPLDHFLTIRIKNLKKA